MATTRSQAQEATAPTCHTENFFYDNDNNSALTVIVRNSRFHIIVDPDSLKSKPVLEEYTSLLEAVRAADKGEEQEAKDSSRKRKRDDGEDEYEPADSGYGSSPPTTEKDNSEKQAQTESDDPNADMHNWILNSFGEVFAKDAPPESSDLPESVYDWYHQPTHFYTLTASKDGSMQQSKPKATPDLTKRIENLIPSLSIPKYIQNYKIPTFTTADLSIVETSSMPPPHHPSIVTSKRTKQTYFLKPVDPAQPNPTKREIKIMKEIESKGLHKKMHVPVVHGLVVDSAQATSSAQSSILGFLQTHIPGATPLTQMLDADVAEDKRSQWSKDSQKAIDILHDNGFVWGDAKADNFMVDEHAKLWIIDFGGSYTEGWVPEDMMETEQGDDVGVEKVVNALEDPENGTFDPEEEEDGQDEEGGEEEGREAKKRKVES